MNVVLIPIPWLPLPVSNDDVTEIMEGNRRIFEFELTKDAQRTTFKLAFDFRCRTIKILDCSNTGSIMLLLLEYGDRLRPIQVALGDPSLFIEIRSFSESYDRELNIIFSDPCPDCIVRYRECINPAGWDDNCG